MTPLKCETSKAQLGCLWLPAILALSLGAFYALGSSDFCLDDAWIHLTYAKSIRLSEGFSYNPGDWETGDSSPLWALLLALLPPNEHIVFTTKIFGIFFHVLSTLLASLYIRRVLAAAPFSIQIRNLNFSILWAGLSCAALPPLLQGATSGMEVSLATALVLAALYADLRRFWLMAFLCSFLAVFARVESFVIFGSYSGVLAIAEAWSQKQKAENKLRSFIKGLAFSRHLYIVWGSGLAFAIWTIYNLVLTGYPFPNTYYIKGVKAGFEGLAYIFSQLLPSQPWWTGITGTFLIVFGCYSAIKKREWYIPALLVACIVTSMIISITIWVKPGVLFFHLRYYLPVMTLPLLIISYGLAHLKIWQGLAILIPVITFNTMQIKETRRIQREQERGIAILHTQPAKLIAEKFAADSRILVEGAGAVRFFTPRTMHIIDVVGLNNAKIAHAPSFQDYACQMIQDKPNLALLPTDFRKALSNYFQWQLIQVFDDFNNMQGAEPSWARVELLHAKAMQCDSGS